MFIGLLCKRRLSKKRVWKSKFNPLLFPKLLFEKMIENERIIPENIAYDRPSDKLLKFLRKYFNLKNYIPQNNNFVIFDDYFLNGNLGIMKGKNKSNYDYENNENYANNNIIDNFNDNKKQIKSLISTNSMINFSSKKKGKFY